MKIHNKWLRAAVAVVGSLGIVAAAGVFIYFMTWVIAEYSMYVIITLVALGILVLLIGIGSTLYEAMT